MRFNCLFFGAVSGDLWRWLLRFVASATIRLLVQQPNATIISVSQNDDTNYCQTGADLSAIQEEGSPAAPMLRAVSTTHHSLISC